MQSNGTTIYRIRVKSSPSGMVELPFMGGLIAGGLAVYWFARRKKMTLSLLLDILAPSVLLAQSIGRWGNFINQEAHGGPVTRQFLENLYLPEFIINQMNINGTYYHPTFLYESLWSLVGFALLLLLRNKNQFLRQGEVALSYVIWYSAGRFFIEGMRTDSLWIGDFLRVSQGLSLVLFVAALGVLMYRRYYTYPPVPYYKDEPNPFSSLVANYCKHTVYSPQHCT